MKRVILYFFLFLSIFGTSKAQEVVNSNRKKIHPKRIYKTIKIDGDLSDDAWKDAEIAKDFIMLRPDNGKKEVETHKTEVKVMYDDNAIYIGAYMYDPEPSKIPMEFTNRDNFGQTDFFLVTINPNDDGQNPFEFVVMSTGSQAESKVSEGDEDFAWNAVWDSHVTITDNGWVVEMKIPYRALRFANRELQSWGFNFHRNIQNLNAQYTWNHIDNTKGIWTQYDGLVAGFKNIKPPTRLTFYPYTSATSDSYDGENNTSFNAGMDVKYGLTDNFTIDATLIPDFGQTAFDNISLNLGPFEQVFNEQRPFFIEGTELFNKAGLFFSRRIGNTPTDRYAVEENLATNEEIIENPENVKMLNAIKVSGRTKKGLGIGVFNAITAKSEAIIKNTQTNETRKVITEPFANYSVLVLDQTFNKNSSITLTNTNVTRDGRFRDGNVTGLSYHIRTKNSKYFIDGSYNRSNISENDSQINGSTFDMSIAKAAGNWRWETGYSFEDDTYDPNDLGILFNNNEQTLYGNISYRILEPKGNFNNWRLNSWWNINYLYKPGVYTGNNFGIGSWAETKKRLYFGVNVNGNIGRQFDYFEARQDISELAYFIRPTRITTNAWVNTDERKKISLDAGIWRSMYLNNPRSAFGFNIRPRVRFNNQFSVSYGLNFNKNYNQEGFTEEVNENPIFGIRDRKTINNTLSAKYNFSINASISVTFRHNWSDVSYQSQFFDLGLDGKLVPNISYIENRDINFNSWNLDLNYIWQFAPGSQLIAFYRNSIFGIDDHTGQDFFTNLNNLFREPQQHIFSLRFVYFIDYNHLKNIF